MTKGEEFFNDSSSNKHAPLVLVWSMQHVKRSSWIWLKLAVLRLQSCLACQGVGVCSLEFVTRFRSRQSRIVFASQSSLAWFPGLRAGQTRACLKLENTELCVRLQ